MWFRFALLVSILVPELALSQIRRCPGGVFSNRECPGEVVLQEKPHVPLTKEQIEKREKDKWLNSLNASRLRAQRKYGFESSLGPIADLCDKGTMEECRAAVEARERDLNQLIAKIESKREEKKRDEVKAPVTPEENTTTAVTIIQNRDYYFRGNHRYPDWGWPPYSPDPYTTIRPLPELQQTLPDQGPELPQTPPSIYHSGGQDKVPGPPAR